MLLQRSDNCQELQTTSSFFWYFRSSSDTVGLRSTAIEESESKGFHMGMFRNRGQPYMPSHRSLLHIAWKLQVTPSATIQPSYPNSVESVNRGGEKGGGGGGGGGAINRVVSHEGLCGKQDTLAVPKLGRRMVNCAPNPRASDGTQCLVYFKLLNPKTSIAPSMPKTSDFTLYLKQPHQVTI